METHDLGRLYWHLHRYPDLSDWELPIRQPIFTELAWAYEVDPPYRVGHGRIFRFWPSHNAVVFGIWSKSGSTDADDAFNVGRAVGRREMLDVGALEIQEWGT